MTGFSRIRLSRKCGHGLDNPHMGSQQTLACICFDFEAEECSHMGNNPDEESKPTHYERDLIKTEA